MAKTSSSRTSGRRSRANIPPGNPSSGLQFKDAIKNVDAPSYQPSGSLGVDFTKSHLDHTIGIEVRLRMESGFKANDGVWQQWLYSPDGVPTMVIDNQKASFQPASQWGGKGRSPGFNAVLIMENCRAVFDQATVTYLADHGMNATRYFDDIIVDTKRVGPRYFDIVGKAGGSADRRAPIISVPLPSGELGCTDG